jgi:predicted nucleic acid-binding protein
MSRTYLMDTNHISAAINPVSRVREKISHHHRQGYRFRTIIPVICELEIGIQDSAHTDSFRRQLKQLIRKVKLVPLELALVQEYGKI